MNGNVRQERVCGRDAITSITVNCHYISLSKEYLLFSKRPEGGVREVRKPQNRTKNHRKPQYRIKIYRNTETAVTDAKAAVVKT